MAWEKLCLPKSKGGLGFRNLYAFNLAMLAKQGWRIISYTTSLVAQILKAKYFPDSSFMDAVVRSNALYVWRSICTAREVIKRRSSWQIGDGRTVKVWGDRWIPRRSTFQSVSTRPADSTITFVSELITEDARWNMDMLTSVLPKEEVDIICTISLSVWSTCDNFIWHFDKKGKFTVKSAYHVARLWVLPPSLTASTSASTSPFYTLWNHLWKVNVPPKVKMVAWRIISDIIPTADNLRKRRVSMDESCILCNSAPESIHHLMIECPFFCGCFASRTSIMPASTPEMWLPQGMDSNCGAKL